mmetsp:Transcript_37732/g.93670  ORF Transcript_37732/g.93670 Transcript_37732/m.93670 type:complete len:200 (+) Transcript_37732:54-653(+)
MTQVTSGIVTDVSAISVARTTLLFPLGAVANAIFCSADESCECKRATSRLESCSRISARLSISPLPGKNTKTAPPTAFASIARLRTSKETSSSLTKPRSMFLKVLATKGPKRLSASASPSARSQSEPSPPTALTALAASASFLNLRALSFRLAATVGLLAAAAAASASAAAASESAARLNVGSVGSAISLAHGPRASHV